MSIFGNVLPAVGVKTIKIPKSRYVILLLVYVASALLASLFSNLNFAWVCMIYQNSSINGTGPKNFHQNLLHWGPEVQEEFNIFFGVLTVLAFVPMGAAVQKFGVKIVTFCGLMGAALSSVFLPELAPISPHLVTFLRSFYAVSDTVQWPTYSAALSKWWPAHNAATFIALVSLGYHTGMASTMILSGYECHLLGWESAFYLPAAVTFIFCLLWLMLYSNEPEHCPYITEHEKQFLHRTAGVNKKSGSNHEAIPWAKLMTSPTIWTQMFSNFTYVLATYVVIEYGPTYLHDELGVKDTENGLLSTLPYIGMISGRCFVAFITAKWPIQNRDLSVKLYNSLCLICNAACLFTLAILPTERMTAFNVVIIQTTSLVSGAFAAGGFMSSNVAVVPRHAAVITSMTNAASGLAILLLPLLVVQLPSWASLFYGTVVVDLITMVVFLIFGKGRELEWSKEMKSNEMSDKKAIVLVERF